jgi:hypothetical protein
MKLSPRVGVGQGAVMDWARILAYVTGTVDQELLARNEYLAAENRIIKAQLAGRLKLSDGEIGHRHRVLFANISLLSMRLTIMKTRVTATVAIRAAATVDVSRLKKSR